MKTILILCSLLLSVSGCATTATPVRDVPLQSVFDPASLAPYRAAGKGSIVGQAFMTTRGGDVKVGAGREVRLFPATPFLKEVVGHFEKGYRPKAYENVRDQFLAAVRSTVADGSGNFEFRDLPPGEYLLEVSITWQVGGEYIPQMTGGTVRKFVTIEGDQQAKVMLTR
jgi:hypothetical protein